MNSRLYSGLLTVAFSVGLLLLFTGCNSVHIRHAPSPKPKGLFWKNYTVVGAGYVNDVIVTGTKIYIATDRGLGVSKDGGKTWNVINGLGGGNSFVVSGQTIYVATDNGMSISKNNGETWKTYTKANGLKSNRIKAIAASGTAIYAVWEDVHVINYHIAGRDSGLSISRNSGLSWKNLTTKNGLASNLVNNVAISENTIYVSTKGGLSISKDYGKSWKNYTIGNRWGDNDVNSVAVCGPAIYAATEGGLSISTNGGATWKNYKMGKYYNPFTCVAVSGPIICAGNGGDGQNGLYISINGGKTWTNYKADDGLQFSRIKAIRLSGSTIYAVWNETIYSANDVTPYGGLSISTNKPGIDTVRHVLPPTVWQYDSPFPYKVQPSY